MKRFILFLSAVIITAGILAQTPQGISHQAVMRDSENNLIVESPVGLQVSIIQGTHDGVAVYVETHNVMTNKNGLISYVIGEGDVVQGIFQDIDWADGPYWLETKADPVGGTNYTISGVTMFLSVPYALHAKTAEDYSETDPLFTDWDKSEGIVITEDQISDLQEYVVEESDPLFTSAFSIIDAQDGDLLIYDGTLGQWVRFTPEYLTDFDETDPLFTASPASGILSGDIENWDASFNWGDHGEEGYMKSETDPLFTAWDKSEGITITESQIMDFGAYVKTETDPLFAASPASGILTDDIENWDAAFNWGDHGEEGYLTEEMQTLADVAALNNSVNTQIKDLTDPTDPQDAATKAYVDLLASYVDSLLERIEALENELFPLLTDIDNNVYQTVIIGNQEWMAENLRVTRYNNEDEIPTGLSNTEWSNTTSGAYAIYNNDEDMLEAYGKLYNWYAVDDARGLCPEGWSVPSDDDWTALVNYVVSQGFPNEWNNPNGAGNALKSCRQVGHPDGGDCDTSEHPRWNSHGTHSGFDEFGFSALPGGLRWSDGSFSSVGTYGYWWSATEFVGTIAWLRYLHRDFGTVNRISSNKRDGFSVRCFRDID